MERRRVRRAEPHARIGTVVRPMSGASCSSALVSLRRSVSPWPPSSSSAQGRLVLVGGEAGVGKTALVRLFCEEHGGSARILSSACDALFTPRPLGPLLDVAEVTGGEFEKLVDERRQTPRGRGGAHGRAADKGADDPGHRGPALGGRGHARRCEAARSQDRGGSRSHSRQLPRRRARPRPPTAAGARRVRDRPGGRAAQARAPLTGGGCEACRAARRRRGRALPQDGGKSVLRHGGARGERG